MVKHLWLLVLILFPRSLYSQDIFPAIENKHIIVLYRLSIDEAFYEDARIIGTDAIWDTSSSILPEKEVWHSSLKYNLENTSLVATALQNTEFFDPIEQAAALGIPLFVDVFISGDLTVPDIEVNYSIRELFAESHTTKQSYRTTFPTEQDLLSYFWIQLTMDVEAFIETIFKPPLILYGPPGAMVYGFTETPLEIPETESISLKVPMPGTYLWEIEYPLYHTESGVFFADQDHTELTLPHNKQYRYSVEMGLFMARFPELWMSWYLSPYWSLGVGIQQQSLGLFPAETGTLSAQPLFMTGLSATYRFYNKRPYSPQLYLSGTVFLRFDHSDFHFEDLELKGIHFGDLTIDGFESDHITSEGSGEPFKTDPITIKDIHSNDIVLEKIVPVGIRFDDFSPVNIMFMAGYNWETRFRLSFFAELGLSLYLLGSSYKDSPSKGRTDPGFAQIFLGDVLYLEFPCVRLGVRFLF
jgi:hypothetical protein